MRNKNTITLNGINSREITGLLIQSLPPISKPAQRTLVEEIDGRDGDIVTPLGFSAYDKEISIGLYGDFEIDDVISFFNSEGTVTFSNEPDKYYNYQINNQIDFDRLLRFRTATVTLHCQPFKYSTEETARTLTATNIINAQTATYGTDGTRTSVEGRVTLTKGVGSLEIEILEDISGSAFAAQIEVTGLTAGQTYTLSGVADNLFNYVYIYSDELWGTRIGQGNLNAANGATFTATGTTAVIGFYITSIAAGDTREITNLQLQKGSKKTAYIPANTVYITNSGNYFARPLMTFTGTGTINLSLNGDQLFVINLGDQETNITIDIAAMEAYQGTPEVLMNRSVTGDYDNFKLNPGKNTISWSGDLTSLTIENYSRWL